jgi:catechol 2,3-dioxygenase-like lactoylglutathione lyase family enzyme
MKWAALVPELVVCDIEASRSFYIGMLGFVLEYEREGFAYLSLGDAQIMLEQVGENWSTGILERPFGRGVNFQIETNDIVELEARVVAAGWPLFRPLQTNWYRAGGVEHGQTEFLIQDRDGYLLRFCESLGERPA